MKIKKIILIIFFYFLTLGNSFALEADVFVQSTVNRASKILSENISKDEKIYLYCRSGNRSGKATKILIDLGFNNVTNLGSIQSASEKLGKEIINFQQNRQ